MDELRLEKIWMKRNEKLGGSSQARSTSQIEEWC